MTGSTPQTGSANTFASGTDATTGAAVETCRDCRIEIVDDIVLVAVPGEAKSSHAHGKTLRFIACPPHRAQFFTCDVTPYPA